MGLIIIPMKLKNFTTKAHTFFNLLPIEWQDTIVPHWNDSKATTQVYVIVEQKVIVAGGLVFSKCPPDMMYYEKQAKKLFKKEYMYLGFIYVTPSQRGRSLGSLWLSKIKELYPKQGLWLAIEDQSLHRFYVKNGFEHIDTIVTPDQQQELVYAYKPKPKV
ncbi:acetyltransferase (GNAT) family protein [Flavobacteriaceae bacterium MAR_2010_105]|nr:acetyltransferase (GNAT) family protein [Flavobacteriaceae bacterium MAR_2010_105]